MALPADMGVGERSRTRGSTDLRVAEDGGYGNLLAFPTTAEGTLDASDDQATVRIGRNVGPYPRVKYVMDVVAASILFILALPVLVIIAFAIAKTSPGGVFFRQTRVGKDMQLFQCLKFRTMVPDAEAILEKDSELARIHALNWKLDNDPRVTNVGKFLRATSLDELPQLVNVINGEMSLIGPRPVQPAEVKKHYGHSAQRVFSVRPGLSGLWQVSGRSNLTYEQRIELDLQYVAEANLTFDCTIALQTIVVVARRKGAQ